MVKPRDNYWDLVKGFAIIGVVSIHFIGGNYADVWTYFVRQFVSMAVFFFIFLAGYFTRPEVCRLEGVLCYYRRRCWRLALPYLVWSVILVAFYHPADLLSPMRFLYQDLALGYGIGIGYYVVVLLQLTLLTPFLERGVVCRPKLMIFGAAGVSYGMAILASAAASGWVGSMGLSVPVPFPGIFATTWILPFVLGLAMRRYETSWTAVLVRKRWLLLALGVVSFVAVLLVLMGARRLGIRMQPQFNVSGNLMAIIWCLIAVGFHRADVSASPICVLGRGSYFVYMTHLLGFAVLFKLLPSWFGFEMTNIRIHNYFAGVITICGLYSLGIWVVEKLPGKEWKRWLALC